MSLRIPLAEFVAAACGIELGEIWNKCPHCGLRLPANILRVQSCPMSAEHIMQFFAFEHLPEHLQAVSRPFSALATEIVTDLPRNPERTVALRKLLEAKDAAVRAALAKDV